VLVKWHNSVNKGFCQVTIIANEHTRQTLSPQRSDPVGMRFRFDFAFADFQQMVNKPGFASLRPLNGPESGAISIPSGRKRKPGPYSFLNPIACKKCQEEKTVSLNETSLPVYKEYVPQISAISLAESSSSQYEIPTVPEEPR
jgi:hypothetical protein